MLRLACLSAVALSAGLCSASFAQVTGKVMFDGNPPEMPEIKAIAAVPQCAMIHKDPVYDDTVLVGDKGEFANVIVYIKPDKDGDLKGPQITKTAVLDQKGCMYSPHVLAVEVGQPIEVKNSDPFLHNVHSLAIDNMVFNFAEPNVMEKKIDPFTAVETFQIKCDVHPWMKAVVRTFDNPYFAVTDETGKYTIDTKGLKDGSYTLAAWQEKYGDLGTQKIDVKGGKATGDFKYKPAGKAEAPAAKVIHLASATGTPACCAAREAKTSLAKTN